MLSGKIAPMAMVAGIKHKAVAEPNSLKNSPPVVERFV